MLQLEGVTGRPRHAAVFEVKEKILGCGGSVLDHQQFSNRVLRLSIEIAAERVSSLIAGIESAGISLSRTTVESAVADAEQAVRAAPDVRIAGTLAIRFMSDEPDLRVPAPPIPG